MENGEGSDHRSPLMAELARALALVRQLESHLDHLSATDSCRSLAPKILSSIQNSILMAKSSDPDGIGGSLASDSPRSENSSPSFKGHGSKEMMKKRKTLHKWTKQVKLIPGARAKDPGDDGHSWRKYGQKDILGTKHPRSYYRCTHRITQGCPATKQVQRSDEDPLLFDITYHGAHTCLQKPQRSSTSGCQQKQHKAVSSQGANERLQQQQQNQNLLLSSQAGLKVKTEGLDSEEAQGQASLSFGSMAERGDVFSSLSTNDCLIGSSSPTFLSPVTSESTYFSMSPYRFDGVMKLQTSDSDLTEIISRANSASNSSLADVDFTLDELDFDQDFQFDASSFFFP